MSYLWNEYWYCKYNNSVKSKTLDLYFKLFLIVQFNELQAFDKTWIVFLWKLFYCQFYNYFKFKYSSASKKFADFTYSLLSTTSTSTTTAMFLSLTLMLRISNFTLRDWFLQRQFHKILLKFLTNHTLRKSNSYSAVMFLIRT